MSKITIQVPVEKTLKLSAERVAKEQGFSSLQEALRLFMSQFSQKALTVSFLSSIPEKKLSARQEVILSKKYQKARKEIDSGKGYVFKNSKDMINFLHRA